MGAKYKLPLGIALFVVILLLGQTIVYGANPYHCSMDASRTGDNAEIAIDTNYSLEYTICSLNTPSMMGIERYVIYYDSGYPVDGERAIIEDAIKRLMLYLETNHVNAKIVDTIELTEMVSEGDASTAIIFSTGMLPSEIYTGNTSDPIFQWLANGGTMYWTHGKIGFKSCSNDGSVRDVPDADILFFGHADVVRTADNHVYTKNLNEGSLTDRMGIYYGEITNGLDASNLVSPYLALDYSDGTYSAVTMVKYYSGSGTIIVFGGQLKYEDVPTSALASVAQTIASRLSYDTELVDFHVDDGSKTINVRCAGDVPYIYMYVDRVNAIWAMCQIL